MSYDDQVSARGNSASGADAQLPIYQHHNLPDTGSVPMLAQALRVSHEKAILLCHAAPDGVNRRVAGQVYDARERLCLDVSLFERLVSQANLRVHTMLVQRRMRPSISQLIRSTIYPDLIDGACVLTHPDVAGGSAAYAAPCFVVTSA